MTATTAASTSNDGAWRTASPAPLSRHADGWAGPETSGARRVLVVGADGLIGGALAAHLAAGGHEVIASRRRRPARLRLDLAGVAAAVPDLPRVDAAVLCAARAHIGDCAHDPCGTRRVNVDGCVALARALAADGAYVVYLSSDKVFDGRLPQRRHGEATCPLTEYGRQKAAAEQAILALDAEVAVLRLSKVLAPDLPLLLGWARALRAGRPITPFSDLFLAPVGLGQVVRLLERLILARAPGIHHCTGRRDRAYSELARRLAAAVGAEEDLVRPVPCDPVAFPPPARPRHSTLAMGRELVSFALEQPGFGAAVDPVCRAAARAARAV